MYCAMFLKQWIVVPHVICMQHAGSTWLNEGAGQRAMSWLLTLPLSTNIFTMMNIIISNLFNSQLKDRARYK